MIGFSELITYPIHGLSWSVHLVFWGPRQTPSGDMILIFWQALYFRIFIEWQRCCKDIAEASRMFCMQFSPSTTTPTPECISQNEAADIVRLLLTRFQAWFRFPQYFHQHSLSVSRSCYASLHGITFPQSLLDLCVFLIDTGGGLMVFILTN